MSSLASKARAERYLGRSAVILAPMEGVIDAPMRELYGRLGGLTFCVSEFLRISQNVPPARILIKHVPEIRTHNQTASGLPVQFQLLGNDPGPLADTAVLACRLGATAIDLNFGCPSNTVNKSRAGAFLLKTPSLIGDIVRRTRAALPPDVPLSVKIRLGWDSAEPLDRNVDQAIENGADWIVVHARTREQAYRPSADWTALTPLVRRVAPFPIVVNGDIRSLEDYDRCREVTGCEHVMLGRGVLADPNLARAILARRENQSPVTPFSTLGRDWAGLFREFETISKPFAVRPGFLVRRMKQWLTLASYVRSFNWEHDVRRLRHSEEIFDALLHPLLNPSNSPSSSG